MSPQPLALATATTPAAKPSPSYVQSAPVSPDTIQHKEVRLHLYAYQHLQGRPNGNQKVIVDPRLPQSFGTLAANDWTLYDRPADGPDASLVARAQGFHIGARMAQENWFICFNMVFLDERFTGSTFKVMGDFQADEGEWTIVGGTGEFAYAQGVITYKKTQLASGNETPCPNTKIPQQISITKIGPWGSQTSGDFLDVPATPHRLESVTIRHGVVIDSLAFSFLDQAGEKHTAGPWGGPRGNNKSTIELAPSEIVTQVSGTIGVFGEAGVDYNAITSLTVVTNVRTYGPFGTPQNTSFSVPVQDNNSIVGFFARAGKYVEALGVYVRPPLSN